jgi:hypothetical protein
MLQGKPVGGTDNACPVDPHGKMGQVSTQLLRMRLLAHAQTANRRAGLIDQAIHRRISRKNQVRAGMSGHAALASEANRFYPMQHFCLDL